MDFAVVLCFLDEMFPPGTFLKAARVGLGLSPQQVAEEAGISRASLSRVEAGSELIAVKLAASVQRVLERHGIDFLKGDGHTGPSIRFPVDFRG